MANADGQQMGTTARRRAWENFHCKFVEMNKEVNVRHPSGSSRARTLWKIRDAKDRGDECHDQTGEQEIVNRDAVREELWDKHLQNPTLAFDEALRRVAVLDDTQPDPAHDWTTTQLRHKAHHQQKHFLFPCRTR